jgi:hypothetical protein
MIFIRSYDFYTLVWSLYARMVFIRQIDFYTRSIHCRVFALINFIALSDLGKGLQWMKVEIAAIYVRSRRAGGPTLVIEAG